MKKSFLITISIIFFMITVKTINILSFRISDLIYPFFKNFDPSNAFMSITIHHIVQALIAFLLILIISKFLNKPIKDFGFNFNDYKLNIKYVLIFTLIWSVIQSAVGFYVITRYNVPSSFGFPLNIKNYLGYFLFEILLSGTSEEIMFRALIVTLMLYLWRDIFKSTRLLNSLAVLFSTLIFMFDHINFSFSPFRITYFNTLQQITVLIFGIFYGFLFVKTKSVFGSILAHNLLNGTITIIALIFCLTIG